MSFLSKVFPVFICFILSSCTDSKRLDELESEIRAIRADTREEVEAIRGALQSGGGGSSSGSRMDQLEDKFADLLEKYDDRGDMAYLTRNNMSGHGTIQTDHGVMLIRLEGIDLNVRGRGFVVHLSIGNPQAIAIERFLLTGDYGSGIPVLSPGQDYDLYNKQIDEWQRTLTPFEQRVSKPLKPKTWTPIDLVLEANSREDLDLMRFDMVIQNAHLDNVEAAKSRGTHAHIGVGTNAAGVLKTDYGAFLIVAKEAVPAGVGTRLNIEIGNPTNFAVNQFRLEGDFGPPIPKRGVGEPQANFLARLDQWTAGLKSFNAQVTTKLSAAKWSEASVLIPGSPGEVQFLRVQMRIENVTLPHKAAK